MYIYIKRNNYDIHIISSQNYMMFRFHIVCLDFFWYMYISCIMIILHIHLHLCSLHQSWRAPYETTSAHFQLEDPLRTSKDKNPVASWDRGTANKKLVASSNYKYNSTTQQWEWNIAPQFRRNMFQTLRNLWNEVCLGAFPHSNAFQMHQMQYSYFMNWFCS